jgi:large subunit ribosomal protein L31e
MKKESKEETKSEEEQEELAERAEEEETEEVTEKERETRGEAAELEEEKMAEESVEKELNKGQEIPKEEVEAEKEELPATEEEVKPKPEEKVEEEKEIVEERTYTIPLSKAWIMPANKRAPKAMRILRKFIVRHMKVEARKEGGEEEEGEEPVKLVVSNEVNERVWSRGIEKPPRKIRVRAEKDEEGNVTVYLAEGD